MGQLTYGCMVAATFDDRTLAHLQFVIGQKLGRGEAFFLTWVHDVESGGGRTSLWLHPHIPLHFSFSGTGAMKLNRTWLEELMQGSYAASGVHVCSEPPLLSQVAPRSTES